MSENYLSINWHITNINMNENSLAINLHTCDKTKENMLSEVIIFNNIWVLRLFYFHWF